MDVSILGSQGDMGKQVNHNTTYRTAMLEQINGGLKSDKGYREKWLRQMDPEG